jgi:Rha family phage regulatory protein
LNQLRIINQNGQLLVDSREVAHMISVRHSDLLEKIEGYVKYLLNGKFRSVDFFFESTYQDSTGRTLKCYLLTRKGCDMVANKMTGEKGVLFTAAYVQKFEEMEKQLLPTSLEDLIIMQAQSVKELKTQVSTLGEAVTTMQETFLKRDEDWRKSINAMLNRAAFKLGGQYRDLRNKSYHLLEERGRCDLNKRLRNLLDRLEQNGATKTQIDRSSKMDVIEADARLKEIYTSIVKELSIGSLQVIS